MHNRKYDLFLSYNPLERENVQVLASVLNDGGISVWFDEWRLVPGQNWAPLREAAMSDSAAIVMCIGGQGSWPERDLGLALFIQQQDPSFKLLPVLLPGAEVGNIPPVLSRIRHIDLRRGIEVSDTIHKFRSAIRGTQEAAMSHRPRRAPLILSIPRSPAVSFVARRDNSGNNLVDELAKALSPEQHRTILLWGVGGTGKTTIAAEAARRLQDIFERRVIWISADGREDFGFTKLLDEIANQLDRSDIRQLAIEVKEEVLRKSLKVAPTLIVIDNFEVFSRAQQDLALTWLSKLTLCSILLVSREHIAKLRTVSIGAMSSSEVEEYLNGLIDQVRDPTKFDFRMRDQIKKVSEGNPLVIQWVVTQIDSAREPAKVFDELRNGAGDISQRVFDRSFWLEEVGDDGRAALLALSLFSPGASRPALAEVSGFGNDLKRLNEAIKRLHALALVIALENGQRLSVAELTRDFASSRLARDVFRENYQSRFVSFFRNYANSHSQPTPEDYDLLDREEENLLAAMDLAAELKDWESLQAIAEVIASPYVGMLTVKGHWDEALRRAKQALEAARLTKDEFGLAQFAESIATIQSNRGEYEEARQGYQEALEAFRKLGSQQNVAVALHELAIVGQVQGELEEARRLYQESVKIYKNLGNQRGVASALRQLGIVAERQGDLQEARQLYQESLEINKNLGNQSGIASALHQLGMLTQNQGELAEARRLYHESLEIEKKLGDQSGVASALHQLGMVTHDQGELVEARRLYQESLEISKKLGNQSGIALTLGQLGMLAEDQGDMDEAARRFRAALEIFEKLGSPTADIARQSLARVEGTSS